MTAATQRCTEHMRAVDDFLLEFTSVDFVCTADCITALPVFVSMGLSLNYSILIVLRGAI